MSNTEKKDWLNDYLAAQDYLVSGHESFRLKLGLPEDSVPAIRYINLRGKYVWILTIEIVEEKWGKIKEELVSNEIFQLINSKFEDELNILLFSSENKGKFSYSSPKGSYEDINSEGLKEILNSELNGIDQNAGTIKLKNKSINDNFQYWTRENLSKFSVINDFDALYLTNQKGKKSMILELKRVEENITTWLPYLDDLKNYERINTISRKLGFSNITLAYNKKESNAFAIHYNLKTSTKYISGERTIFNIEEGTKTKLENYESKRSRR
nr:hypothetical protein [Terribacillus saccharophilus]